MKKYSLHIILFSIITCIFACTEIDELGSPCDTNGEDYLNFNLIIPSTETAQSDTRTTTIIQNENRIDSCDITVIKNGSIISTYKNVKVGDAINDSIYRISLRINKDQISDGTSLDDLFNDYKDAVVQVKANVKRFPEANSAVDDPLLPSFYMSGIGKISSSIPLKGDIHLMRGVAKVSTILRTTAKSSLGNWTVDYDKSTVQILHAAPVIRSFAPFKSHMNDAINENLTISSSYIDYSAKTIITDWGAGKPLDGNTSNVKVKDYDKNSLEIDSIVTSYDQYIYENWLENESDYSTSNNNITTILVNVKLSNSLSGETSDILRTIYLKTDDSYHVLRNHVYTIDVKVISPRDVDLNLDVSDWNKYLDGTINGESFTVDRKEILFIDQKCYDARLLTVTRTNPQDLNTITFTLLDENKEPLIRDNTFGWSITAAVPNSPSYSCSNYNKTLVATTYDRQNIKSPIVNLMVSRQGEKVGTADELTKKFYYLKIECGKTVKIIPVVRNPTATRIDTKGTANCYMIEKPGVYSFKANIPGNGADGITEDNLFCYGAADDFGSTLMTKDNMFYSPNDPQNTMFIEWQDRQYLIDQAAYDFTTGIVTLVISNTKPGNALISLYKMYATTTTAAYMNQWSWHIWFGVKPEVKYIKGSDGKVHGFLNSYLGASSSEDASNALYYQYGRPIPIVNLAKNLYKPGGFTSTGLKYYSVSYSSYSAFPLRQRMNEPESYCLSTNENDVDLSNKLWGKSTTDANSILELDKKTVYDPCPVGYMVPNKYVYNQLLGQIGNSSCIWNYSINSGIPVYFDFSNLSDNQGNLHFSNPGRMYSTTSTDYSSIKVWTTGLSSANSKNQRATFGAEVNGTTLKQINMETTGVPDGSLLPIRCVKQEPY